MTTHRTGFTGRPGARWTGHLPLAATVATAGLSVVSLWWVVPTALCAGTAGWRPGRTWSTAVGLIGVVAGAVVAVAAVPSWITWADRFVAVVAGAVVLPWFVGRFCRQYRELVRAGWERAARLEREQRLIAEQARLRERARIAQDMHDVLGHELSLIALSAGALKLAPGLADGRREAARDIRARAAAAVDRLGEVIGVLRQEPDGAPPEPGGAGVAELVERASASGLTVRLRTDGEPGELPSDVERAVHRVVQEALTNVAKHAPGAEAAVRVRHTAEKTEVRVANGPAPTAVAVRSGGAGFGLIGLDERVGLVGGTFGYGPESGGFAVRATFPRTPAARRAAQAPPRTPDVPDNADGTDTPGSADGAVADDHRRARRRLGRTLVAALMVPLVAGALLIGALRVWDTLRARESVLAPDDYARLRIGQDRDRITEYLPERQTGHRPTAAEPRGSGLVCEYYAMTADPFDDRSGDVYRLCFRHGTLVTADAFTGKGVR
ncbi:histidine kinase [Streptomyces violaceusniger]|uniref:histidine kinase n=2 Tax=Streptomyces violaceusniger group TaxID=2839105 RepID=A0ABD5J2M4_9ACTN|nr:histidine kinase [Streptomyces violaceusniger]KUL52001.1 histidine kinase [Streptomyces violaceusniger]MEE4582036.1 histidine kinase [Streptomyces sp. DSM 41602]